MHERKCLSLLALIDSYPLAPLSNTYEPSQENLRS